MLARSVRILLFAWLLAVPATQAEYRQAAYRTESRQIAADKVLVIKSERRLFLMRGAEVLRSYRVALGLNPVGPKERSGDFRTPEGLYRLTNRNFFSQYFLSIKISYPDANDQAYARRNGWEAGGQVMIHGLPNTPKYELDYYSTRDWTNGCIALTNADMLELWSLVARNAIIEIRP